MLKMLPFYSIKRGLAGAMSLFLLGSASIASNTPFTDQPTRRVAKQPSLALRTDIRLPLKPNFDTDPIRFTLRSGKSSVRVGEEFELSITAHYFNISPSLLFTNAGSNEFRLKLLLPEGFVQTGGDYVDYIGAQLSPINPTVTYRLKGFFRTGSNGVNFRLLRGQYNANENSLFVDKGNLTVKVTPDKQIAGGKNARSAADEDYASLGADCGSSKLIITGHLTSRSGGQINAQIYKSGLIFTTLSDLSGPFIFQEVDLRSSGSYQVRLLEVNNDGNNVLSPTESINCPNGETPNPNPPANNCNWSPRQFIISWYGEQIYAHYYNGILYAAYQDGLNGFKPREWLIAASAMSQDQANCFATQDPHNSGTSNPPSQSGNCSASNPAAHLDHADCGVVSGWALDQANLNQPLLVEILVNGTKVGEVVANGDRPDLADHFGNSSARYHGYNYSFPSNSPWNSQSNSVTVRICGSTYAVNGSPRTFGGCGNSSSSIHKDPNCTLTAQQYVSVYNEGRSRGKGLRDYLAPNYIDRAVQMEGYVKDDRSKATMTVYEEKEIGTLDIYYLTSHPDGSPNIDQERFTWVASVPREIFMYYKTPATGYTMKINEVLLTSLIINDPAVNNNLQNITDGNFPPYDIQCPAYKAALYAGFLAGVYALPQ